MTTWLDLSADLRLLILARLPLADAIALNAAIPVPLHSAHIRARVARLRPLRDAWVAASQSGIRSYANLPLHRTRAARRALSPAAFSGLSALLLAGVQLESLRGVSELRGLRVLDASRNCLKELPDELESCQNLRVVNVGSNELKEFPSVVLGLPELHTLLLHHNWIRHLPEEWEMMKKLERLGLCNCAIRGPLPEELCRMLGTQTEQRKRRSANLQRNRLDTSSISSLFRRFPLMASAVVI